MTKMILLYWQCFEQGVQKVPVTEGYLMTLVHLILNMHSLQTKHLQLMCGILQSV